MAVITEEVFAEYRKLCEDRWGVRIVEKKTSRFMKAIAFVLFFTKGFLSRFITTIGTTVYWPNADRVGPGSFKTLFHEAQHAYDYKKLPPFFILSYLSPQVGALFALLAWLALTGDLLWLGSLFCLVCVAPWPSVFRTHWEMRGYSCGLAVDIWFDDEVRDSRKDFVIGRFTSADYYFMWPFRKWMRRKLEKAEQKIRDGKLTEVQQVTYDFLVGHGVIESSS